MASIKTINPATEEVLQQYELMSVEETALILRNTSAVAQVWANFSYQERAELFEKFHDLLQKKQSDLATLISQEMGKPRSQALAEIEKSLWLIKYNITAVAEFISPDPIASEFTNSYLIYQPLGPVLGIMPWNYPLWQVMRFAVGNLLAGNVVLLKHALNCTGTSLYLEKIFIESGFPSNVFRSLVIDDVAADELIADPAIKAVSLTGSERAGSLVAASAGRALKKVVLELGGSDPYLILEDADLELAARECVESRLANSGQVCISAKRLITLPKIRAEFKSLVLKLIQEYRLGNPQEDDPRILGPLARADLRLKVDQQVQQSIKLGANLLIGGEIPAGVGFYYPVTVLDQIKPGMPAYEDEIFGPVFAFLDAEDENEAVRLANDTRFGLSAVIFTQNIANGEALARRLQAGSVAINQRFSSHPKFPFGGIKNSGYGKELSCLGVREFLNAKMVLVK